MASNTSDKKITATNCEQLHLTIQFDWDTNVEPIEAPI
jgi:hypothetical protein